jgi:hypothetical protein
VDERAVAETRRLPEEDAYGRAISDRFGVDGVGRDGGPDGV